MPLIVTCHFMKVVVSDYLMFSRVITLGSLPGLSISKSMVRTSGRQRVQTDYVKNVTVKLPPPETQKKIVAVLSALDDEIELNNAIDKNLEEQAQTIFKNMFSVVNTILWDVPVVVGELEPATYHNESNTAALLLTIAASDNAGYVRLWNFHVW